MERKTLTLKRPAIEKDSESTWLGNSIHTVTY